MATPRKRSTRTARAPRTARTRPSRARSSGPRSGHRRRRPTTSTTLGSAAAIGVLALVARASWGLRIGLVLLVIVIAVGYALWTRRARIAEQGAAESAALDLGQPS